MTLLKRFSMALASAIVVLNATAAPIEFTVNDFERAAASDGATWTAWFEEDKVQLKRDGEFDLEATPPSTAAADPAPVPVPEPEHYKLVLIGVLLLLLVGARRATRSPWNAIKVSQQAD